MNTKRIEDAGKPKDILERLNAIFIKWQEKPITDETLEGIYKDIEKILDEYELEEATEAKG